MARVNLSESQTPFGFSALSQHHHFLGVTVNLWILKTLVTPR